MIELSSCSYFKNDVDIRYIIEAAIHLDDVGMVQKHLNFDLTDELLSNFLLMQQFLFDNFQGTNKICIFFLHQIHSTIFTIAELLYANEVIN